MKKFTLIIIALSALLFTQCEIYREGCMDPRADNYDVAADIDDGSCVYTINPDNLNCPEAEQGNLSITNQTEDVLFLYKDVVENSGIEYQMISCIPANTEDFVIDISNQENEIFTLQVWKASQVANDEHPQLDNVYRQWSVALSNEDIASERANWLITDNDVNKSSGTLNLSYPAIDQYNQEVIYQVDVFLNSKNGSRLASLQPGYTNKKVSVDYGAHYLYFRYWYSDPGSSSGDINEIGWNEMEGVVINAEHKSSNIDIPAYQSTVGKYGYIRVYNSDTDPISIYANDQLIENIAKIDGSSDGLSIIPSGKSTNFVVPIETYSISAKTIDGTTTILTYSNVDIISSDTAHRHFGPKSKEVSITNSTSEDLLLFNESGQYLGKVIDAGKSSGTYLVQSSYDSLLVMTYDKTKKKKIAAETGVTVSSLDDFIDQEIEITSEWNMISTNLYESPDIDDDQSTSMTATVTNNSAATLSFEYKLSTEYKYDKFYFSVDGYTEIDGESGDKEWTYFSIDLSPGTHSLNWTYTKDGMFSVGNDNVQIRNINLE